VAIKNGQSRDTDNIGHTRNRTKTNKSQNHNTENKKDEHEIAYRSDSCIMVTVEIVMRTGDKLKKQIVRETRRSNHEWTIQRH
jgi:hypothetical protein